MIEGNKLPPQPERLAEEPSMSIDDFVTYGLEPGQRGLIWDHETKTYVHVAKGPRPYSVLSRLAAGLVAGTIVHGFFAISLIGGMTA